MPKKAIKKAVKTIASKPLVTKSTTSRLNPEQLQAVAHDGGPLLIVAGAGTGKTTVITERICYLIKEKKVLPDEILALTFTDKAAGEMQDRVDKLLPLGYFDLWIQTFHAFGQKLLENHALDIGLTNEFKLLGSTESWLLVRNNLDKFNLDYYRPLGNPTKFVESLVRHFSRCKDELVKPADYLAYAEQYRLDNDLRKDEAAGLEARRLEEIANAYHVYQKLLLDNNFLDFGDLINYTLELLQTRPQILDFYRKKFKYILVDEFQDTNYAQYQLLKLLAAPVNNITVVGDDDQAIYKFRGASISNILQFKADYPGSQELFLTTNYRSRQNILDLSYNFIQLNNPERLEVKLSVGNKKLSKKLQSPLSSKGIIEHLHAPSAEEEVALVIKKIQALADEDPELNWNDFAVLVRANDQAKVFTAGLEQAGIPFQFVASKGLYGKDIILNLISFLRLLDNYQESDAVYRVLTMPMFNLSMLEISQLAATAKRKALSLYEVVMQAPALVSLETQSFQTLRTIIALVEKYSALARTEKASRLVFDFLNDSHYLKYIDGLPELAKRQQFSYLNQFYKRIKAFEELNQDASVKNFLTQLGLELEAGEQGSLQPLAEEAGPDMVKVMTVHGAKGLEFSYIFVVNMVDQRFPTRARNEAIDLPDALVKEIIPEGDIHLQEERRLFYVAMTRAKKGIFFTSAQDYGGARKKKISQFLQDLGFAEPVSEKSEELLLANNFKANKTKSTPQIWKTLLPQKFSYTQIKDFQNCPRTYYYRYIVRLPLPGAPALSFGNTIHTTLQNFFEEIKKRSSFNQNSLFGATAPQTVAGASGLVSLDELLALYAKNWQDDWYETKAMKEEYKKKGKAILKDFYYNEINQQVKVLYLEKMFNIKVGEYSLTGKIDRVDEVGGNQLRVVDYKTGKPKAKLESDDKKQLLIYQLALRDILPASKIAELLYYYLEEGGSLVPVIGTDKELDKLREEIIGVIQEIRDFDFPEFLKNHAKCRYCQDII
ncbi:MAG: UvrD-helicase domain-containing protein [Candidatus Komeilibacteria bacterium]|nr:UvrD-helicase domain-containing protein [Candidatus Komeilibacteria bacterium]